MKKIQLEIQNLPILDMPNTDTDTHKNTHLNRQLPSVWFANKSVSYSRLTHGHIQCKMFYEMEKWDSWGNKYHFAFVCANFGKVHWTGC